MVYVGTESVELPDCLLPDCVLVVGWCCLLLIADSCMVLCTVVGRCMVLLLEYLPTACC